jgi:hypothetical protein
LGILPPEEGENYDRDRDLVKGGNSGLQIKFKALFEQTSRAFSPLARLSLFPGAAFSIHSEFPGDREGGPADDRDYPPNH